MTLKDYQRHVNSKKIDNLINSTSPARIFFYNYRKKLGQEWLNTNYPEWKSEFKVGTPEFKKTYGL